MELLITRRELSILQLLAQGLRGKQVIDVLGLSDISVVSSLMSRAARRNKLRTLNQLMYVYATKPHKVTNQKRFDTQESKRLSSIGHAKNGNVCAAAEA